jgi:citrate lyase subunit beta/citryl-CoA lyase
VRPRSYLYVPGDAEQRLGRAPDRGADALIVDLEDAVPVDEKERAREVVRRWLEGADVAGTEVWVRVNPEPALLEQDLRALAGLPVGGIVLAKTERLADLRALDRLMSSLSMEQPVMPLLESAASVLRASEIAAGPRVDCLQIGEADLRADVGAEPGEDESELLFARSAVVYASAAAGLPPPVAPVSTEFRDLSAFAATTRRLARMGHTSRACIHPAQVPVVHEVVTPTPHARARAQRVVTAFEAAVASGAGVLVGEDGRLVDEAVVRQARRVLNTATR